VGGAVFATRCLVLHRGAPFHAVVLLSSVTRWGSETVSEEMMRAPHYMAVCSKPDGLHALQCYHASRVPKNVCKKPTYQMLERTKKTDEAAMLYTEWPCNTHDMQMSSRCSMPRNTSVVMLIAIARVMMQLLLPFRGGAPGSHGCLWCP
jgi:hypothetical protein